MKCAYENSKLSEVKECSMDFYVVKKYFVNGSDMFVCSAHAEERQSQSPFGGMKFQKVNLNGK